jgi:hypothetical protein
MKLVKMAGLAVVAVFVLVAFTTTAAFAAAEVLPNKPTKPGYTVSSGAGKLVNLNNEEIACKKDKGSGKITGAKTTETTIDFEECTAFGFFAANSLGDPSGTILVKLNGELCAINESKLEVGVYFTNEPVHIEVPSLGALDIVEGSIIGKITTDGVKAKVFTVTLEQASGDPKWTSCGGKTAAQTSTKNEGTKVGSGMSTVETQTGEEEVTIDG